MKMRTLILMGIFGIVVYISLSQSAPVLEKRNVHNHRATEMRIILKNQMNSARHQAENLFHEYVQASTSLPEGYTMTEAEVLNIFPQVDFIVAQTFSLNSAATLLCQLTESVTSLRADIANTLIIQGSLIDGRLVSYLEQLVGQLNQIRYRLPRTSSNLPALAVTNLGNDDQKRVMATLSVTKYFLEYLIMNF